MIGNPDFIAPDFLFIKFVKGLEFFVDLLYNNKGKRKIARIIYTRER